MSHMKLLMALIILIIALLSGIVPFKKKHLDQRHFDFPIGEAIACGVFLGAGLIHMLSDSAQGFMAAGYSYPFAFLIAGISFLFLLLLEHVATELQTHQRGTSSGMALLATLMLTLHSLFEGTAVGTSGNLLTAILLSLAIIAHKWAASFSLSVQINKSQLNFTMGLGCFLIFACMTPIGILVGNAITQTTGSHPLLMPIFSALAAGTFLYIGTLHGLRRAVMIERCCNMPEFIFMILGFSIMALVAVWT